MLWHSSPGLVGWKRHPDTRKENAVSDSPETAPNEADHEDEQHRKFREALERKKAGATETPAGGARNEGISEAHNDKQVRQFRRKSGS